MIDLHTHTTFSDGTFTPTELVTLAAVRGLSAVAVTDHDTLQSCCATTAAEWAHLKQRTTAYHDPGRFAQSWLRPKTRPQ